MLAYVGFMLAYVGFMLAHVGIILAHAGFMLGQVGSCWLKLAPSWPQDAFMLAQVGLKMPKMASQDLQKVDLSRFLTRNCSFWSALDLQNIQKTYGFISSFAYSFFVLFFVHFGLRVCSKLAQVCSH